MSYASNDDKHDGGKLTQFRERLSGEVQMQTGEEFDIFQDRKHILWGQNWKERIEESLDAVTFLIPIITPSFFNSSYCREELQRFLERERKLNRSDLILPVYYVSCPLLYEEAQRANDKMAQVIAARQYADWRDLRFESFHSPQTARRLVDLAIQIREALERTQQSAPMARPAPLQDATGTITKKDTTTAQLSTATTSVAMALPPLDKIGTVGAVDTRTGLEQRQPPQRSAREPIPSAQSKDTYGSIGIDALPNLTPLDTLVLKLACEEAIEIGNIYIETSAILPKAAEVNIPHNEVYDCKVSANPCQEVSSGTLGHHCIDSNGVACASQRAFGL